jgi:hypothetical protein
MQVDGTSILIITKKRSRVQFGFPWYQERVMKKDAQISHQTISSTMHTNNERRRREEYEAY